MGNNIYFIRNMTIGWIKGMEIQDLLTCLNLNLMLELIANKWNLKINVKSTVVNWLNLCSYGRFDLSLKIVNSTISNQCKPYP